LDNVLHGSERPFFRSSSVSHDHPQIIYLKLTSLASDVLSTLKTTRSLFASYIRIRSSASSASSPELTEARNELETTVQDLSTDLQDLVDSVRAVEGDPFRYGLDIDEVGRRRQLVQDVGDEVESMRQELAKTVIGAQSKGQGMNGSLPPPSAFDPDELERDDYGAFEQQQQTQMMHEQDEALDGVFKTVGNLRQQADDMGRELEEQGEMLEDVDKLADRVQGKLANGIKRVGWVIKNNEGMRASNHLGNNYQRSTRHVVKLLHRGPDIRPDLASRPCSHTLSPRIQPQP